MLRLFFLLSAFLITSHLYAQNLEEEIRLMASSLAQGKPEDCRKICMRLLGRKDVTDVQTKCWIKLSLASADLLLGYTEEGKAYVTSAEQCMKEVMDNSSYEYCSWLISLSAPYSMFDKEKAQTLLNTVIRNCEDRGWVKSQTYVLSLLQLCKVYNSMQTNRSEAVNVILRKLIPLSKEVCGNESTEYILSLITAMENAERRGDASSLLSYSEMFVKNPKLFNNNSYIRNRVVCSRFHSLLQLKQYDKAVQEALSYSVQMREECLKRYQVMTSSERQNTMNYIQTWFLNELPRLADVRPTAEVVIAIYDGLLFAKGMMLNLDGLQEDKNDGFLNIHWSDIQQKLKQDEAAVEFLASYNDHGIFNRYYYKALVLKAGQTRPKLINIGEWSRSEIDFRANSSFFWNPLKQVLSGVHRLYFSPYGEIHVLPIESFLPQELGNMKVFRLSSTRQIVIPSDKVGKGIALYGGISYDDLPTRSSSSVHKREAEELLCFLPGTKKEIEQIANVLKGKGSVKEDVTAYSGAAGTEESFKALSNKKLRIIHLATHGFYFKSSELRQYVDSNDIFNISGNAFEDQPLMRSGLFMAGANYSLLGEDISAGVDDGVLTAQEISLLNLRGSELVALSACDSAEGDIGFDGVFGLQRGFKKAGVQSILMSLWQVDDEATCLLMTEFYKNWIGEKMSKHDALEAAKRTVRSHKEKGWDDPRYWAAFILLDGLDP